jgi:hypothetical protein
MLNVVVYFAAAFFASEVLAKMLDISQLPIFDEAGGRLGHLLDDFLPRYSRRI